MHPSPRLRDGEKPSALACVSCRKRHLKCDGNQPICTRCSNSQTECIFVRSRRGFRTRESRPSGTNQASPAPSQTSQRRLPVFEPGTSLRAGVRESSPNTPCSMNNTLGLDSGYSHSPSSATISVCRDDRRSTTLIPERLITTYYEHIHPAHPFVIPRRLYAERPDRLPTHLRHVMCFMASHIAEEPMIAPDLDTWFAAGILADGFHVQALLLLALCSFARFERETGGRALMEAQGIASRIGMDTDGFESNRPAIIRESWRRTWWEMYIISGLISLVSGVDLRVRLCEDLTLPGHCGDYDACNVQVVPDYTATTMRQRFVSEHDRDWSSFAYKMEAARVLTEVLHLVTSMPATATPEGNIGRASALISAFRMALPKAKKSFIRADGAIDEVMSCALMIIDLADICLHFPRSGIVDGNFKTVCGNGAETGQSKTAIDRNAHRAAALRAANDIAWSISSRSELATLSPCFSCAISFAAAVHLALYVQEDRQDTASKEHIDLELIALKTIGGTWPIALVVQGQVAQFARQVMQYRDHATGQSLRPPASTESFPVNDSTGLDEQWLRDFLSRPIEFPTEGFYFELT